MSMIFFGFKSCGKTYFGKHLAKELNWEFLDTDFLIEQRYEKEFKEKLSCREIAQKRGEEFFREVEKKVICSLEKKLGRVVSVGGGAILNSTNCQKLQTLGKLIYLTIDKETLKQRLLIKQVPSYLDEQDLEGSFEKMYQERKSLYEKIQAFQVSTHNKTELEVLEELKQIAIGADGQ